MDKPLAGVRVLVTRRADQAGKLALMIVARGGEPVRFPLLDIAPADDPAPLRQAIARLDDYALAIFISPNAVGFSVPQILAARRWPAALQAVAVGPATATELTRWEIGEVVVPALRFDSESLLEVPQLQRAQVAGKKVLILRGNDGRELIAETLAARGAHVDAVACYKRSAPSELAPLVSLLRNRRLDAVTVFSSQALRLLPPLLDTESLALLRRTPVFVPYPRIALVATELGCEKAVLSAAGDAGIIEALCAYNWPHHE